MNTSESVRRKSIAIMNSMGWHKQAENYSRSTEHMRTTGPLINEFQLGLLGWEEGKTGYYPSNPPKISRSRAVAMKAIMDTAKRHPDSGLPLSTICKMAHYSQGYMSCAPVWFKQKVREILGDPKYIELKVQESHNQILRIARNNKTLYTCEQVCRAAGFSRSYLSSPANKVLKNQVMQIIKGRRKNLRRKQKSPFVENFQQKRTKETRERALEAVKDNPNLRSLVVLSAMIGVSRNYFYAESSKKLRREVEELMGKCPSNASR